MFVAAGTFKNGIALLGEITLFIILSGNRLLDLPVVAQGGEGFRFCLLTLRAGQQTISTPLEKQNKDDKHLFSRVDTTYQNMIPFQNKGGR